jgi:hypothetical protein
MAGDATPWHRRLALKIAHKLPDDPEDARKVLAVVHELLEDHLARKRSRRKRQSLVVVPMPGKDRERQK